MLSNPFTYTIVVSGSRKLFIIWKATKRGHPKQTALPSHTYSDSSVRKYFRHACRKGRLLGLTEEQMRKTKMQHHNQYITSFSCGKPKIWSFIYSRWECRIYFHTINSTLCYARHGGFLLLHNNVPLPNKKVDNSLNVKV